MAIAVREGREEKFKWLIRPFMWAFNACLLAMLAGVSLATDTSLANDAGVTTPYVIGGLISAIAVVAGLVAFGIIRMRAAYEG